jgi:hypothetical protein
MNKIVEIVTAWATAINPSEEQKEVAQKRLEICMGCENWKENAVGIAYCGLCGCATKGKVFSPKGTQACPQKKWTI